MWSRIEKKPFWSLFQAARAAMVTRATWKCTARALSPLALQISFIKRQYLYRNVVPCGGFTL